MSFTWKGPLTWSATTCLSLSESNMDLKGRQFGGKRNALKVAARVLWSMWRLVTSSVTQGSVLDLVLLNNSIPSSASASPSLPLPLLLPFRFCFLSASASLPFPPLSSPPLPSPPLASPSLIKLLTEKQIGSSVNMQYDDTLA